MRYLLPLIVITLAGCAPSVVPAVSANGRAGYEFKCGGWSETSTDCLLKATAFCANGFSPVGESPTRLVAVCAPPRPANAAAGTPAATPVVAGGPAPAANAPSPASGNDSGYRSAGASPAERIVLRPQDVAGEPQSLDAAQKEELFREFDAYLADHPDRARRSR